MTANGLSAFLAARDFVLRHRESPEDALQEFRWPSLTHFNWALDYFDTFAANHEHLALWLVDDDGTEHRRTYQEMSRRSNQVANYLRTHGVRRGHRILLMLSQEPALWESLLAIIKLGAVAVPASTLLSETDLADRLERGAIRHVIAGAAHTAAFAALDGPFTRIVTGAPPPGTQGWLPFSDSEHASAHFTPDAPTAADELLLLYFTSGTTAKPKIVQHSHQSYPVGHLSTLSWLGLQSGDVHWNISSPGWAKHSWSSFFAPWSAGATVFAYNYARFDARRVLDVLVKHQVTTLCAPPTVWRMLVQEKLSEYRTSLRELLSAGEPLNPELIETLRTAWNLTIREGYGQTETTALIGNRPGHPLKVGSMGRPLPGYRFLILDEANQPAAEGELCLDLSDPPTGLMLGYADQDDRLADQSLYRTGDIVSRDANGYFHFIGRADDVFKSSDYRLSPFELESVLLQHPAVAEAAVVPSPDPLRLAVPKAFITLAAGHAPDQVTANHIFAFLRRSLAPYQRIRRLEFRPLPKTISGKIRRGELRREEATRGERRPGEFLEGAVVVREEG